MVHDSAGYLIDYIKLVFHADMGDGHLENFESGRALDFDITSTVAPGPILGIVAAHVHLVAGELSFIASAFYLEDDPLPASLDYSSRSLRGPPSIS